MKKFFIAVAMLFALAGCNQQQPQIPQIPQVPQAQLLDGQVQQMPQQAVPQQGGIDGSSALLGAAGGAVAGYMMGKAATPSQGQTVIVDRRPVYSSGYSSSYRPNKTVTTTTTTTTKRGFFGGTKTRTTTTRSFSRRR